MKYKQNPTRNLNPPFPGPALLLAISSSPEDQNSRCAAGQLASVGSHPYPCNREAIHPAAAQQPRISSIQADNWFALKRRNSKHIT